MSNLKNRQPLNCKHFHEYEVCKFCDTPIYKSDVVAFSRLLYNFWIAIGIAISCVALSIIAYAVKGAF